MSAMEYLLVSVILNFIVYFLVWIFLVKPLDEDIEDMAKIILDLVTKHNGLCFRYDEVLAEAKTITEQLELLNADLKVHGKEN